MADWSFAIKVFVFGLSAVFFSLGILIAAIYGFGIILGKKQKQNN